MQRYSRTILVVDEDDVSRAGLCTSLNGAGYLLKAYYRGEQALSEIKREVHYELAIISNNLMGRVNGDAIAAASKTLHAEVPVIGISKPAESMPHTDCTIYEPFQREILFGAIRKHFS